MSNNINGQSRGGRVLGGMDFYRRVPRDLTEATLLGVIMSVCAIGVMAILFLSETAAFVNTRISTAIALDENDQPQLRLNFNITMMDLHCDYVSVDVWDALGTNRQNVTKNVEKWQLDSNMQRRIFSGRNRETREIQHDVHDESLEDIKSLTQGQQPAVTELKSKEVFDAFLKEHEMAFVDFFAPWCVWCQRLAPTWEKFAQQVKEEHMPVGIGHVDCVEQPDLCRDQKVMAFPTLRWYHEGSAQAPDYKMDRTVQALYGFAKRKLEMDEKFKEWSKKATEEGNVEDIEKRRELFQLHRPDHPACQVSGHLMVNRVPGNFHIEAKSKHHNLNAAMTNLSHIVNHLSFGDPLDTESRKSRRILKQVPATHQQFAPMNGQAYLTTEFHQAYHHYIKVVSTHLNMGSISSSGTTATSTTGANSMVAYQFLEQSQIVHYQVDHVPEARFSYDLSPMSVVVQKEGRKWYDYLTSLCAIIGGTFTTLGLIDATLYRVFKPKKL